MIAQSPGLEELAQLIGARTGLAFSPRQGTAVEAGIRRAMARAKVTDVARYLKLVEAGEVSIDDLISELTVGETYFFREHRQFDFIREVVFADVLHRRGAEHVIQAWSAGCASGEEAYSLAVALEESGLKGRILGTDISQRALLKAREARYPQRSLRGVDSALVDRVFRRADDRFDVAPRFVGRVTFMLHNLAQGEYPPSRIGPSGADLILCRNVLIYLDEPTQGHVARGLHQSLAEGGWLITGSCDPRLDSTAQLMPVVAESGVFYRKGARARPVVVPAPILPEPVSPEPVSDRAHDPAPQAGNLEGTSQPVPPAPVPRLRARGSELVAEARAAFDRGEYDRVLNLTRDAEDDVGGALHVRALANCRSAEEAVQDAQRRLERHPLSRELHFLQAVLLVALGRDEEAIMALKRVLYLDRSLVIASFLLGSILRRRGKSEEAWRAYRNARDLARARPPDEAVTFGDGESARRIADAAAAEMERLEAERKAS